LVSGIGDTVGAAVGSPIVYVGGGVGPLGVGVVVVVVVVVPVVGGALVALAVGVLVGSKIRE